MAQDKRSSDHEKGQYGYHSLAYFYLSPADAPIARARRGMARTTAAWRTTVAASCCRCPGAWFAPASAGRDRGARVSGRRQRLPLLACTVEHRAECPADPRLESV